MDEAIGMRESCSSCVSPTLGLLGVLIKETGRKKEKLVDLVYNTLHNQS